MGFDSFSSHLALALHPNLDAATTFLLNDALTLQWVSAYQQLRSMGFDHLPILITLKRTNGDVDRSMECILQQSTETDNEPNLTTGTSTASGVSSSSSSAPTNPRRLSTSEPSVTAQYSDEEVRSKLLVHKAVFDGDMQALSEYAKRQLVDQRDHMGMTPLLLAHALDRSDLVSHLLNRGADPRLKSPSGWSLLQQAVWKGQQNLAIDIHLHTLLLKQSEWDAKQKSLLHSLTLMDDFYMEIGWEIKSWVPLVGRFAPKDVLKIWKKGGQIRLDTNVRGMNGVHVEKGLMSFLFTRSSVWAVDHVHKSYTDALEQFRNPNFDEIQAHVAWLMRSGEAKRSELNYDQVQFKQKYGKFMRFRPKSEKIGEYQCEVWGMEGLKFIELKASNKESLSASSKHSGMSSPRSEPTSPQLLPYSAPTSASSLSSMSYSTTITNFGGIPSTAASPQSSPMLIPSNYFGNDAVLKAYNKRRRKLEQLDRKRRHTLEDARLQLNHDNRQKIAAMVAAEKASTSSSSLSSAAAAAGPTMASSSILPTAPHSDSDNDHHDDNEEEEDESEPSDSDLDDSFSLAALSKQLPSAVDNGGSTPRGMAQKTTSVSATLWFTPDFPLPVSHLLLLLDLLSPASSQLAKLRDMLSVQLPTTTTSDGREHALFPIRVTFPVVTQVDACVTFNKYIPEDEQRIEADEIFKLPTDYRQRCMG